MKIFLAATSLCPDYGGPAYSVSGLAAALGRAGGEVGLWAADQSAPSTLLLPPNARVSRLSGDVRQALAQFDRFDVMHDNDLWLPHHHRLAEFARRARVARVVSTRGMLEPWAARHKWLKKKIAWHLYQRRDLERAQLLHTTAAQEADHLARFDLGVPIRVISNGVDPPEISREGRASGTGKRTALFLGRIYPVKGLPMLIEAWARVRPLDWRLVIAGPDEAGHRAAVERAIGTAGLMDVVSFAGPLDGAAKREALLDASLLVLPSLSESFGMAVAEALAYGVPVLTTSATPWAAVRERGCGWCVAPNADAIAAALAEATACAPAALGAMGAKGRAWMAAEFGWDAVARQFIAAYEQAISARPQA